VATDSHAADWKKEEGDRKERPFTPFLENFEKKKKGKETNEWFFTTIDRRGGGGKK